MSSKVLELSDSNFDKEALKSDIPVLVDFWAPWCGPCRMLAPVLEELAMDYQSKAKITKINVDENSETSVEYQVRTLPTVLIFKSGYIVESIQGVQPITEYRKLIDKHIS